MPVTGSCHCGKLGYTLDAAAQFTAHGDPAEATIYRFNHHNIRHTFCRTCGCAPYGGGTGPDGQEMAAINLRCADGIDPDSLRIHHFDGASL